MVDTKKFEKCMTAATKRQVLATIASLFDPLGHLTPTTVKKRPFLQNLWIQEKGWDNQLENEDIEIWQKITAEMEELSTISVPRHIGGENPQLIGFCDASEKTYSTAIYLKTLYEGKTDVNPLFPKWGIAPKQKMQLVIGMRSLKFMRIPK